MLHKIYLPFSEDKLREHFVPIDNDSTNIENHVNRYKKSIKNYELFESKASYNDDIKLIRQIEKDETFWTASSLMTIFHCPNRNSELIKLLTLAFGEKPPLDTFTNWDECLTGELNLFFEPNIPSPKIYLDWLKKNVTSQNFIPYIIEKTRNSKGDFRSDLEGATNVDALIINSTNGFAIIIEAKVLSDISYQVSYDSMRNQIIRNIDVMLSQNENLAPPLNTRIPDNSLFILLTPKLYKDNPRTRLYGYTFQDYKNDFQTIKSDLVHRNLDIAQCESISNRIGWITWEDLKSVNNDCCKWLNEI
ncbi:MAG: hypothetical protein KF732_08605 [Flavobacteriales bacterium]|nr:hypothetical protein [Flavobacteriales bacterium]MBX2960007.1 hypothetical protein [Flavobacteriales bacterium]